MKKYLQFGGMPYLIHLPFAEEIIFGYLKNLYESIVLKDVVARTNLRNYHLLERLLLFLADNTGSLLTAKTISDYLKSQKMNMSVNTLMNYLKALENAFIVHRVGRYNIRKLILSLKKRMTQFMYRSPIFCLLKKPGTANSAIY